MTSPSTSYRQRRYEILRKLGIEQLPVLRMSDAPNHTSTANLGDLPIRTMPVSPISHLHMVSVLTNDQVPGRKCPTCLTKGNTVWVIPGKRCPQCGTQVN